VSTTVSTHQNFVGGEWVDAAGGETMEVLNPATGETIAEVPRSSAEDVDRAVQAAKKALPARPSETTSRPTRIHPEPWPEAAGGSCR
jgi:malonate-semialdehyde dehydrogenase (acetylating)/methylmalonate-semialdehyde dehydrogenase